VGYETADDAAVYRVAKDLAVVETVDFFPPVVDDPFVFGEIAAANSMSDIWAMGAKPLFALNLVAFPKALPLDVLGQILAGGQSKAQEAGIPILGGHSIDDPEPKYGMAVTGVVPKKVLTNPGAKVGTRSSPTPLGIGTTAIKRALAWRRWWRGWWTVRAEQEGRRGVRVGEGAGQRAHRSRVRAWGTWAR
jgi:selenide,water dikinase